MLKKFTKETLLNEFKFIHLDKYDYSLIEYINNYTNIK